MNFLSKVVLVFLYSQIPLALAKQAEDDSAYAALTSISLSTSIAPDMQQKSPVCEVCGCSFCPEGFEVGTLEGLIAIPDSDVAEVPCSLLDYAGTSGQIPETECNDELRLFPVFREVCGCPPLPSASKAATKDTGSVKAADDKSETVQSKEKTKKGDSGESGEKTEKEEKETREKDEGGEKGEKDEGGEKGEKDKGGEKGEKDEGGEKGEKDEGGEKGEKDEGGEKGEKDESGEKGERDEGGEKEEKMGKGESEQSRGLRSKGSLN